MMNLSLGLTTSCSIERIKWIADRADNLGFYGIWIGEDIGGPQEVFTASSLLLLGTRRVKVGIGVTSPLLRNITTIARAAVTISEISPSRFKLGLGVGGLQDLPSTGIHIEKPAELMRRTVNLLRTIWAGQSIPVSDERLKISDYRPQFSSPEIIPIFLGVRAPRLLTQAADIADGVILSGPKRYIEEAIKLVRGRRAASGLSNSRFSFVLWVPTVMLQDGSDLELAKKAVSIVVSDTPDAVLDMAGIPRDEVEVIKGDIVKHGLEEAAENISNKLVNQFCISGDAEGICKIFRNYIGLGVDEVVFGLPYGRDPKDAISQIAETWGRTR